MTVSIHAVLVGGLAPLGSRGVPSGIYKRPTTGPLKVQRDGLSGDAQGDRKNHGGPEKAVHHYPYDHYAGWRREIPSLVEQLGTVGAFGENVSSEGMTEKDVCVGDIYRLGTALVQVSQGRQPCWRLNERFGEPTMARQVQESRRTGWYYRVLEEGRLEAGDSIALVERPADGWTLERIMDVLYRDTLNLGSLARLADLPELADSWRKLARRRLERQAVEDWSRRLTAPGEPASDGRRARETPS